MVLGPVRLNRCARALQDTTTPRGSGPEAAISQNLPWRHAGSSAPTTIYSLCISSTPRPRSVVVGGAVDHLLLLDFSDVAFRLMSRLSH